MNVESTNRHAINLFTLTVENRHGAEWVESLSLSDKVALAEEIVSGFGAKRLSEDLNSPLARVWRFPDGSEIETGAFGLRPITSVNAA